MIRYHKIKLREKIEMKSLKKTFVLACFIIAAAQPMAAAAHSVALPIAVATESLELISAEDRRSQEALQHLVMALVRSLGTDNPDLESVAQFKQIKASADDLLKRYPDRRPSEVSDSNRPFFNGIRSLRTQYGVLVDKINSTYPTEEPRSLANSIATLESLTQRAASEEMISTFKTVIPRRVAALENRILAYRELAGGKFGFRSDLVNKAKSQIAQTLAIEQSLSASIIEANEPPLDAYMGLDKDILEQAASSAILEKFPEAQIIDVVLPEKTWRSQVVWRWQEGSWNMVSHAQMKAIAMVQGSTEEEGWLIPFSLSLGKSVAGEVFCVLPDKMERPGPALIVALPKGGQLSSRL